MKSRASIQVLLWLFFRLLIIEFTNAEDDAPISSVSHPPSIDEHNKLLLECQHSDYRTYIKCLKRQKRHHWHDEHESDRGDTKKCFDECGMEQCESTKCVHDCHKHCMKKTKETRQIITQYETTCVSDDCTEKSEKNDLPGTTNITTNIDINNVINNHMPKPVVSGGEGNGGTGGNGGTTGGGGGGGGGTVNSGGRPGTGGPDTNGPSSTPNWPCTSGTSSWYGCNTGGLTLVPQVQFVPQITFGLGINSFGNGYWPNQQRSGIDCSSCGNPFMRYRCDVSCYNVQGSGGAVQNIGRTIGVDPNNCISPHCVGGT